MKRLLLLGLLLLFSNQMNAQGWGQTQKIVPDDRFIGQQFGHSVAIDGIYAVVGMNNNNNIDQGAYVFKDDGNGNWMQIQKLENPNYNQFDSAGFSVAIDGDYIFVGDLGEDYNEGGNDFLQAAGAVYVFKNDGNDNWNYDQKLVASDREALNQFGWSVSVSGDYAIIGAGIQDYDELGDNFVNSAGAAYIFERDGSGTWNEVQKIVAPVRNDFDYFGRYGVTINDNYLVVGANFEDEDASEGNTISSAGSAYIFERDGTGTWNQVQKIVASDRAQDEWFGYSVGLDGNHLLVGSNQNNNLTGAAYVFEKDGNDVWNEVQKLTASNGVAGDRFGQDIDIDGNRIIIGAHFRDIGSPGDDGAAYIFEKDAGIWTEIAFIYDAFNSTSEYFGFSVGISGDYALVGTYRDDEDENEQNYIQFAGATFIFDANETSTLSIVEINSENSLKAYPNPTQSSVNIDLQLVYETIEVSVVNILAQEIMKQTYYSTSQINLDVESLKNGIYLVNLKTNNTFLQTFKIIKE